MDENFLGIINVCKGRTDPFSKEKRNAHQLIIHKIEKYKKDKNEMKSDIISLQTKPRSILEKKRIKERQQEKPWIGKINVCEGMKSRIKWHSLFPSIANPLLHPGKRKSVSLRSFSLDNTPFNVFVKNLTGNRTVVSGFAIVIQWIW